MKIAFSLLLIFHGLTHLLGFVNAFHLIDVPRIPDRIPKFEGTLWLLATLMFLLTLILFLIDSPRWWIPGAPSIVLSQTLIIMNWTESKWGTLVNLVILIVLIISFSF